MSRITPALYPGFVIGRRRPQSPVTGMLLSPREFHKEQAEEQQRLSATAYGYARDDIKRGFHSSATYWQDAAAEHAVKARYYLTRLLLP